MAKFYEKSHVLEELVYIAKHLPWDGALTSKPDRNILYENGLIDRVHGWNFVTKEGVKLLHMLDCIRDD